MTIYQKKLRKRLSKRQRRGGLMAFVKRHKGGPVKYDNDPWDKKYIEEFFPELKITKVL